MKIAFALMMIACLACSNAYASFQLKWSPSTTSTTVGSTINVDLILQGTDGDAGILNTFGLAGASFTITNSGVAGILNTPASTPSFDGSIVNGTKPVFTFDQTSIGGVKGTAGEVKVGSFVIDAMSVGSGNLSVTSFGNLDGNGDPADFVVFTNASFDTLSIDSSVFTGTPTFSYTITAVPEPTSIVGGSLLGVLGIWVARRKRLAKANAIKK